jgi:hypothetical protein
LGVCWSSTGLVIIAPGVKTVHWIGVGVLLEQLGVCWSSSGLVWECLWSTLGFAGIVLDG